MRGTEPSNRVISARTRFEAYKSNTDRQEANAGGEDDQSTYKRLAI